MRKLDRIPLRAKLHSSFSGILIRIGFLIVLISSIFISVFIPNIDTQASKYEKEKTILLSGILTQITETNLIAKDQRIYQYNFTYNYNGNTLQGSSYSNESNAIVHDTILIEVIANDPKISRIKGMTNAAFSAEFYYFFPIIFIVGIILIVYSTYNNLLLMRILKNGFEIVRSELVSEINFSKFFIRKSNHLYKLNYKYSIRNKKMKKVIFVQLSEFQLNRIRYSGIVIGPDSGKKGFVLELLPSKIKELIKEQSNIAITV